MRLPAIIHLIGRRHSSPPNSLNPLWVSRESFLLCSFSIFPHHTLLPPIPPPLPALPHSPHSQKNTHHNLPHLVMNPLCCYYSSHPHLITDLTYLFQLLLIVDPFPWCITLSTILKYHAPYPLPYHSPLNLSSFINPLLRPLGKRACSDLKKWAIATHK